MCIQEAQISPGAKRIIERAFESHTDTEATWDLLQVNCLLVQREELIIGEPSRPKSGLLGRMRNKQEQEAAASAPEPAKEPSPIVRPPTPVTRDSLLSRMPPREREAEPPAPAYPTVSTPEPRRRPDTGPDLAVPSAGEEIVPGTARKPGTLLDRLRVEAEAQPESPVAVTEPAQALPPEERPTEERLLSEQTHEQPLPTVQPLPEQRQKPPVLRLRYPPVVPPEPTPYLPPGPRVLVVKASGHRILLPEDGELILGRLDPLTRVKPDIDLTFEDRLDRGISRMHASINGWQGRYELTDLGSNNGTWLNDHRLPLQRAPILQVGDEVRLGSCALYFDQAPEAYSRPFPVTQFFFYCTFSGHFFPLPEKATILIGRADPALGYTPDIDLSQEGDAASVVSRRHAKLICNAGQFLVEDLGSANKTKIDGRPVYVGTQVPISPGQHLWLGGCVLALDMMEGS
jgi:pSer/pThr/pTyr-binding forkhead associated (FHA) protein